LLADKAAALDPGFGFDAFALVADWTEDLDTVQESLVEEPTGERDLARLIDRLTVKLGPRAVRKPKAYESHLPERASGWDPAVASLRGAKATKQSSGADLDCFAPLAMTANRPHRLLDRPEAIDVIYATPEGMPRRFVWRRAVHDIARVEGPERISPEWWRERSSTRLRDYYRVEDEDGRRYWIYREGLFGDGRGGAPGWYLHGLFG
jgi:protein ImuB